jgi:capsular exopolysaccharide synthesis family protein
MLLGTVAGLLLGFLYHVQRPPLYQSSAQVLVIKTTPGVAATGQGADARVAYVEDYVATQVTLLTSDKILKPVAEHLNPNEFQVRPPDALDERVAFLKTHFAVARVREPGTNTPNNVLTLTFRCSNPADAEKYLAAIIRTYQAELGTLYEEASNTQVARIDTEIQTLRNERSKAATELDRHQTLLRGGEVDGQVMPGISQEDLATLRTRIATRKTAQDRLTEALAEIDSAISLIESVAGKPRSVREGVMAQLNVTPVRRYVATAMGPREPEEVLEELKQRRAELGTTLGPDHSQMIALRAQIDQLEKELKDPQRKDALDWYLTALTRRRQVIVAGLEKLAPAIAEDERKAKEVGELQAKLDRAQAALNRLDDRIKEKELEKAHVLTTRSGGGYKAESITPPGPGAQVAPILYQSLLFGGLLGLLVGGGCAAGASLTDRGFHSPAEIRRRLGVPVLGHVPTLRTDAPPERTSAAGLDRLLVAFFRPTSTDAEAFRGIRTQLYFSIAGRGHQVIQVTSPNPGDGKSVLAANLAISIAQSGKRVVLLDCDFRRPRVHQLFHLRHPEVGLASVMAGEAKLESAVQGCEVPNLLLMPCGPRPANPAELLTSAKFAEVLAELRAGCDFVVVDSPPVLAVSDPSAVAPRVDAVLLVCRMTKDARPTAERAREQLAAVGARVIGAVVNAATDRSAGYDGYGYAYQYHPHYAADEPVTPLPKKG